MAWTTVETPNAKYILVFSGHGETIPYFSSEFDALVLEHGKNKNSIHFQQFGKLVEQAAKGNKQVWMADTPVNKKGLIRSFAGLIAVAAGSGIGGLTIYNQLEKMFKERIISRRQFVKIGIGVGLLSPLLGAGVMSSLEEGLSKEIKKEKLWEIKTKLSDMITGKGNSKIRNAVSAEKTESFLAPRLARELGRKPVILMAWGSGHYGIKRLLMNPKERRRILTENKLEKYLIEDYPKSYRIDLDSRGNVRGIEEFQETLKPQNSLKSERMQKRKINEPTISRRKFLAMLLRRKRV